MCCPTGNGRNGSGTPVSQGSPPTSPPALPPDPGLHSSISQSQGHNSFSQIGAPPLPPAPAPPPFPFPPAPESWHKVSKNATLHSASTQSILPSESLSTPSAHASAVFSPRTSTSLQPVDKHKPRATAYPKSRIWNPFMNSSLRSGRRISTARSRCHYVCDIFVAQHPIAPRHLVRLLRLSYRHGGTMNKGGSCVSSLST
jgi:hypothetical protein